MIVPLLLMASAAGQAGDADLPDLAPELSCRVITTSGGVTTLRLQLGEAGVKLNAGPVGATPMSGPASKHEGRRLPFIVNDGVHGYYVELSPPLEGGDWQDVTLSEARGGVGGLILASGFCGVAALAPLGNFHADMRLSDTEGGVCPALARDGRVAAFEYAVADTKEATLKPVDKLVWRETEFEYVRSAVAMPGSYGDVQFNLVFLERDQGLPGPWGGSENISYSLERKRGVQIVKFNQANGAFGKQPIVALCTPKISYPG